MEKSKYLSQQPWADFKEWKSCYDMLFNNVYGKQTGTKMEKVNEDLDDYIDKLDVVKMKTALKVLRIWGMRGDSNNLVLTTVLLAEEIIKIKDEDSGIGKADNSHILAQKIIRVTNLIIDEIRKKSKGSNNMFLVAKEVDFPEFIIEIRHSCTHKNLPSENVLIFVIKYLYHWVKEHLWDKQYSLFEQEGKVYQQLTELLTTLTSVEKRLNEIETIASEYNIKLEIQHIKLISELFVRKFLDSCKQTKKTVICEKQEAFDKIYQVLQLQEMRIPTLMIYNAICEEIYMIVKNIIEGDKSAKDFETQLSGLAYLSKFLSKSINKKKSDMELTISMIQKRLFFSKDFSAYLNDIYLNFIATFKDEIKGLDVKDIFNDDIALGETNFSRDAPGSLLFKQLNGLCEKKKNYNHKIQQKHKATDNEVADNFDYGIQINTDDTLIL
jgi:ribosomal biogenesis protein LAS1